MSEKKYIKIMIIACAALSLFVFSCTSFSSEDFLKQKKVRTYTAFNLFFSFQYLSDWHVFEKDNEVQFSNTVSLLTLPKDEQVWNSEDFLSSLYLSDSDSVSFLYENLKDIALHVLQKTDFSEIDNKKDEVIFSSQRLINKISKTKFDEITNIYKTLFNKKLSEEAGAYIFNTALAIVDINLNKNKDSNMVTMIIINPITDTAYALLVSRYNIVFKNNDSSLDIWQEYSYKRLLVKLVAVAQSTKPSIALQ